MQNKVSLVQSAFLEIVLKWVCLQILRTLGKEFSLQPTHRKVSEKPLKKALHLKQSAGALRYTFALTDVAVTCLLGTKYLLPFFYVECFNLCFDVHQYLLSLFVSS